MGIPTVLDHKIKAAIPERSAWLEAWGFLLLGAGLYLALACYSFSPYDYAGSGVARGGVQNLAGPAGALAARFLLGRFGVLGMVWPVAVLLWGVLTVTGFAARPKPRRVLGLVALATDLAGFATLLLPDTWLPEPSFGFGGMIGDRLNHWLVPNVGYGGALIALSVVGIVALVLTGNFTVRNTKTFLQDARYHLRRFGRRHVKSAAKVAIDWTLGREIQKAPAPAPTANAAAPAAKKPRAAGDATPVVLAAVPAPRDSLLDLYYDGAPHGKPAASLFTRTPKAPDRSKDFSAMAELLTTQLAEFKIMGEIEAVTEGPIVTTYEFRPAPGTKVAKVAALGEDLARLLKAQSLRVLAPIPGKDTVGFEVPNAQRNVIGFADLVDAKDFRSDKRRLPIAMGVDIFGSPVFEDLAEMPHLLVAGSTGSGKSVFMNTLIGSLIARHTAQTLRLIMIDPKMVEMAAYATLPHLACPVITDPSTEAKAVLNDLAAEMDDRYKQMRALGARNIESFNDVIKSRKRTEFVDFDGRWAPMPYVVLIIDEMADMMMLLGKEAEAPITRLAQKARACGIHLVIATQRPSADVVTGLIKANFPTRVAFRVLSGVDSRTILDQNGAETLLGKGDMLYLASGGTRRMHGAYLSDGEVQAMVKACGGASRTRKAR
jgi:S-DNA-T family DNA segregation ATPase FtsK/SpoIIIE